MGVHGLWPLLEPSGKPVPLESLEGKIVAIDVSVWLHQSMRGNASHQGSTRYAHLITLFLRIVKLLFYRIKPVFIFDGPAVPVFKQRTLTKRRLQKDVSCLELNKVQRKLLLGLAKKNAFGQIDQVTNDTSKFNKPMKDDDVLFDLPPSTPIFECDTDEYDESDNEPIDIEVTLDKGGDMSCTNEFGVDFESDAFHTLPIETQREILIEAQERNRESRLCSGYLAPDSKQFSKFQMDRMIHRGKVNYKLDVVNKELAHQHVLSSMESLPRTSTGILNVRKIIHDGTRKQHILLEEIDQSEPAMRADNIEDNDLFAMLKQKIYDKHIAGKEQSGAEGEPMRVQDVEDVDDVEDDVIKKYAHPEWFSAEPWIGVNSVNNGGTAEQKKHTKTSKLTAQNLNSESSNLNSPPAGSSRQFTLSPFQLAIDESVHKDNYSESDLDDLEDVSELSSHSKVNVEVVMESGTDHTLLSTSKDMPTHLSKGKDTPNILRKVASEPSCAEQSLTMQMQEECQQLLTLFGLPFVNSPGEAEAQCAWLQRKSLVSAVVTEDSDVWLFGATQVYRNMFRKDKRVQYFTANEITQKLGLTRDQLTVLAMLAGCDYTQGVDGVGVVSALEIISEFSEPGESTCFMCLSRFHDWWTESQRDIIFDKPTTPLRARLRKLDCKFPPSFPDKGIFDSFMQPNVQVSKETFSWGKPQFDKLRDKYCGQFAWDIKRFEDLIKPLKDRSLESGAVQTHISSFMTKFTKDPSDMKVSSSKRVHFALKKLKKKNNDEVDVTQEVPTKPAKSRKRKVKVKVTRKLPAKSKNLGLSESSDSS